MSSNALYQIADLLAQAISDLDHPQYLNPQIDYESLGEEEQAKRRDRCKSLAHEVLAITRQDKWSINKYVESAVAYPQHDGNTTVTPSLLTFDYPYMFPFIEDQDGSLVGLGHQHPDSFYSAVLAYDLKYYPDRISILRPDDVQYIYGKFFLSHLKECSSTSADAIPLTVVRTVRFDLDAY